MFSEGLFTKQSALLTHPFAKNNRYKKSAVFLIHENGEQFEQLSAQTLFPIRGIFRIRLVIYSALSVFILSGVRSNDGQ